MPSRTNRPGYLLIDHRNSPGTPEVPGGATLERDIVTCSHCQRGVVLNPLRTRDRGYCPKCDHYICDECEVIRVQSGDCNLFARRFDAAYEMAVREMGQS